MAPFFVSRVEKSRGGEVRESDCQYRHRRYVYHNAISRFSQQILKEDHVEILFFVFLLAGDSKAISECNSSTYVVIIVVVIIILVLVILALLFNMCRSKRSGEKKAAASLWAESHALSTKPSEDD